MSGFRKFAPPLLAILGLWLGRDWLRLGWQAWHYPVAGGHDRGPLRIADGATYLAAGADGLEVRALAGRMAVIRFAVPAGVDRIDDIALADGFLFALDATSPGHLAVYSLADPMRPALVAAPIPVEVGPFSGVSAAAGIVAVSGGTSRLSLRGYDARGVLGNDVAFADYGRGQPDIALSADGKLAAISTHLYGPKFAITIARVDASPLGLQEIGQMPLPDAGFTHGGSKPAHFPIVAAWAGTRLYVAHGGGLDAFAVDATTPPRSLAHDPGAAPAMDIAIADDRLYVLRAGSAPAVLRYRISANADPALESILPISSLPSGIATFGDRLFLVDRRNGWQAIAADAFPPATP